MTDSPQGGALQPRAAATTQHASAAALVAFECVLASIDCEIEAADARLAHLVAAREHLVNAGPGAATAKVKPTGAAPAVDALTAPVAELARRALADGSPKSVAEILRTAQALAGDGRRITRNTIYGFLHRTSQGADAPYERVGQNCYQVRRPAQNHDSG